MYPSQHGAWSLGTKLFEDVPTLGGLLTAAGYVTGLVGKAHFQPTRSRHGMESIETAAVLRDLDYWRAFRGPWYGFQNVETARMHACECLVGAHYAVWMEENGLPNWADYFESWPPDEAHRNRLRASRRWDLPQEFHYTHWTGERTMAQIDEAADADRPFFIWSSFHDPHPPYLVSAPWCDMYDPRDMQPGRLVPGEHDRNPEHFRRTQDPDQAYWVRAWRGEAIHGGHPQLHDEEELRKNMACYYGMTSFMDAEIGRILERLDARGLAEDTIVVFSSDHGHFLGQHGLIAKAIHHYEDLLRVPFIVRWPGRVPADAARDAIQSLVDLAPSFLAAAGVDVPGAMTGVNQLATWSGGAAARSGAVVENHHGSRHFHMRSYVESRYKITVYRDGDDGELFDLQEDPGEIRNLWHDPAAEGLKGRMLHAFMQATLRDEPMRMPRISGA
jgi:arylsulfatase A-like enzyme